MAKAGEGRGEWGLSPAALVAAAGRARAAAYCPYSGFAVGAAALARDGEVYTGCNVENAAFGASICAERVALYKAVSEGAGEVVALAVVAGGGRPARPCGTCLQVLAELAPAARLLLGAPDGGFAELAAGELLPEPFGMDPADRRRTGPA